MQKQELFHWDKCILEYRYPGSSLTSSMETAHLLKRLQQQTRLRVKRAIAYMPHLFFAARSLAGNLTVEREENRM